MQTDYAISEVANILNVSNKTVINWIEEYRILAEEYQSGMFKIHHKDLVAFLESNKIPVEILENGNMHKKRILIVDDEPEVLDILEEKIGSEEGYDAEGVSTAFEAGVFIRRYRPHVVVLDISLSDIDGRKVCQIFKADDEVSHTKIIGISGKITPPEENQILSQGFDAYLRKPFDLEELTTAIDNVLE